MVTLFMTQTPFLLTNVHTTSHTNGHAGGNRLLFVSPLEILKVWLAFVLRPFYSDMPEQIHINGLPVSNLVLLEDIRE